MCIFLYIEYVYKIEKKIILYTCIKNILYIFVTLFLKTIIIH